jgi:hypothetical protein
MILPEQMDDEKQKQINTQWSMALKGYLNHQVRAFGVQAPTVLAAKPLRRFLHLTPRLCNHPITPNSNQTDSLFQPSSAKSRGNRSAPLDSPVTQMTRPAKGPFLSARALAAAVPREAEEEATEAAEEGWCIPGSTSLAHPLLATTSTPLLRGIAGEAGGGTRAAHVGETLKGRRGSVRRGESKAEGFRGGVDSGGAFKGRGRRPGVNGGVGAVVPFSPACARLWRGPCGREVDDAGGDLETAM